MVRTQYKRARSRISIFLPVLEERMRLLFAHAFIGLVIVAIGISVEDSFPLNPTNEPKAKKKGLNDAGPTYHAEISGIELAGHSGRYHVDPIFREEFSNFHSIDLPASESDFMAHAHELRDISELKREKLWRIKSLVVESESITFQTTTFEDESYVFSGRFLMQRGARLAPFAFKDS
jgi:hypothetical protein